MEHEGDGVKNTTQKPLLICLISLIIIIIILIVGIIINTKGTEIPPEENNGDSSDSYVPSVSLTETTYNTLNSYAESDGGDLHSKTIEYCSGEIDKTEQKESVFKVVSACAAFMIEHEYYNDAITILDDYDAADISDAELLNIYQSYIDAYQGLGDSEKATEYDVKYQKIKNNIGDGA